MLAMWLLTELCLIVGSFMGIASSFSPKNFESFTTCVNEEVHCENGEHVRMHARKRKRKKRRRRGKRGSKKRPEGKNRGGRTSRNRNYQYVRKIKKKYHVTHSFFFLKFLL